MENDLYNEAISSGNDAGNGNSAFQSHLPHQDAVNHIGAILYCLEQAKHIGSMTSKQLEQLAIDFEHCNTALVTWLLLESMNRV